MRNFILRRSWLFWIAVVATLGYFYAYQRGWEDAINAIPFAPAQE